jgi:hypothetical protein
MQVPFELLKVKFQFVKVKTCRLKWLIIYIYTFNFLIQH